MPHRMTMLHVFVNVSDLRDSYGGALREKKLVRPLFCSAEGHQREIDKPSNNNLTFLYYAQRSHRNSNHGGHSGQRLK